MENLEYWILEIELSLGLKKNDIAWASCYYFCDYRYYIIFTYTQISILLFTPKHLVKEVQMVRNGCMSHKIASLKIITLGIQNNVANLFGRFPKSIQDGEE